MRGCRMATTSSPGPASTLAWTPGAAPDSMEIQAYLLFTMWGVVDNNLDLSIVMRSKGLL